MHELNVLYIPRHHRLMGDDGIMERPSDHCGDRTGGARYARSRDFLHEDITSRYDGAGRQRLSCHHDRIIVGVRSAGKADNQG